MINELDFTSFGFRSSRSRPAPRRSTVIDEMPATLTGRARLRSATFRVRRFSGLCVSARGVAGSDRGETGLTITNNLGPRPVMLIAIFIIAGIVLVTLFDGKEST